MGKENTAGGLSSYISNNDTMLTPDNYNDVDGLVFAQLSYSRFEDVTWTPEELSNGITVRDYAQKLLDTGTYAQGSDNYKFLESLTKSDRYSNARIHDMEALNGTEYWSNNSVKNMTEDGQWAAMTIDIDKGTSVVAMRGTDGTELGWREDLELAYDPDGTTAQQMARDYFNRCDADQIYGAGHSKGANDIESGYVMADPDVRARIARTDIYDGPGNNDEFKDLYREGYEELEGKQTNHRTENSIIGNLLNDHPGETKTYKADTEGHEFENAGPFGEHDPHSWLINEDGTFVEGQPAPFWEKFDEVTDNAIDNMNPQEREAVVSALTKLGVTEDIANGGSTGEIIKRFLHGLGQLTDEEKKALGRFLQLTIAETAITLYDTAKEGFNNFKDRVLKFFGFDSGNDYFDFGQSVFRVDVDMLKSMARVIDGISGNIGDCIRGLENAKDELDGFQYLGIKLAIDKIWLNMLSEKRKVNDLSECLDDVALAYMTTEGNIMDHTTTDFSFG